VPEHRQGVVSHAIYCVVSVFAMLAAVG
jgi:hypothetical protein